MDYMKIIVDTCIRFSSLEASELFSFEWVTPSFSHVYASIFSGCSKDGMITPEYSNMTMPRRIIVTCRRTYDSLDQSELCWVFLDISQQ